MVVMTSLTASALPGLPCGSYILVRPDDTGGRRNGVLFRHAEGWGMPPGTGIPEPRFLADGDVEAMTGSGTLELVFNPETPCGGCNGTGRTLGAYQCQTCSGRGCRLLPWELENYGRCGSCGGTGGEYHPGWGFTNSNCSACEGSGWDDSLAPDPLFLDWLDEHSKAAND